MTATLGIDIGGSGIKAAPVDTRTGELLEDRHRIATPQPATPKAVAGVLSDLRAHFGWDGHVGAAFPGVVRDGTVLTAANLHKSWIGVEAASMFSDVFESAATVVNDADAAGLAEVSFGSARGVDGTVVVVTLGTGIGTALFTGGRLVRNTELGHLELGGIDAETWTSARVREAEELSWKKWGRRLGTYLAELERLLWPDLFVIGGGVSRQFDKYSGQLDLDTPVTPASMRNRAGVVGAALAASVS